MAWASLPNCLSFWFGKASFTTGLEKPPGSGKASFSAGLEKPAGMADQPEKILNKRRNPLGSGTTNATRRANRANLQWGNLAALGDPDTVEPLEAHVQALEKARAKAEQKKALLEKTRSDAASGCASSSVKPAALEKVASAALEKAAPAALEKAQGSGDGDSYSYYSNSPSTSAENERPKAKAKPRPKGAEPFLPKQELGATQENQKEKMRMG